MKIKDLPYVHWPPGAPRRHAWLSCADCDKQVFATDPIWLRECDNRPRCVGCHEAKGQPKAVRWVLRP